MRDRCGMTLTETLLSIAVAGTLLAAVGTSVVTGQSAFNTSEAFLSSQQAARSAIDAIEGDLAGSQVYSYSIAGTGKTYIKFRRINVPDLIEATDPGGHVSWQGTQAQPLSQIRMYLWCTPQTTLDPCTRLTPPLNLPSTPPGATPVGPLMLITTVAATNPNGEINVNAGWTRNGPQDRVLAQNVSAFTLQVWALDATGNPTVLVPQVSPSCNAPSPGMVEGCVNRRAHTNNPAPDGLPAFHASADVLPAMVDIVITTTSRTAMGREVSSTVRRRVKLRNSQGRN